MNVLKSLSEVAKETNSKEWEVQKAYENTEVGMFFVNGTEVIIQPGEKKLEYIIFNSNDNNDCKKYMMEYELKGYEWKVYVDSIEGWQECKVIDIQNTRMGIDRATVVTASGTQLNRICKFVIDEYEIIEDGCIYFYEIEI